MSKVYQIKTINLNTGDEKISSGTLEELIEYHSYTLLVGQSWQHEKGNKKINLQPKNIKSLISNLNNAKQNAASNGYSSVCYELA